MSTKGRTSQTLKLSGSPYCVVLWIVNVNELGSLWTVLDSQDFIVVRNKFKKKILIGYLNMSSI